jgi:hypothetical protein
MVAQDEARMHERRRQQGLRRGQARDRGVHVHGAHAPAVDASASQYSS